MRHYPRWVRRNLDISPRPKSCLTPSVPLLGESVRGGGSSCWFGGRTTLDWESLAGSIICSVRIALDTIGSPLFSFRHIWRQSCSKLGQESARVSTLFGDLHKRVRRRLTTVETWRFANHTHIGQVTDPHFHHIVIAGLIYYWLAWFISCCRHIICVVSIMLLKLHMYHTYPGQQSSKAGEDLDEIRRSWPVRCLKLFI